GRCSRRNVARIPAAPAARPGEREDRACAAASIPRVAARPRFAASPVACIGNDRGRLGLRFRGRHSVGRVAFLATLARKEATETHLKMLFRMLEFPFSRPREIPMSLHSAVLRVAMVLALA